MGAFRITTQSTWKQQSREIRRRGEPTQECLQCGNLMGAIAGTKKAICTNCGWKDPCCE